MKNRSKISYFLKQLREQEEDRPEEAPVEAQASGEQPGEKTTPSLDAAAPPAEEAPAEDIGPADAGAETEEPEGSEDQLDPFTTAVSEYLDLLRKSGSDHKVLEEALLAMRDGAEGSAHRTFVEMNLSAISLLEETVVVDAQKKIRRGKNADSSPHDVFESMEEELSGVKELSEAVQRISALGASRGSAWRQLVAALCGGAIVPGPTGGEVHVPVGGKKQKAVVVMRPQAYLGWGAVDLGGVTMTSESPDEYLGGEERVKLSNGSPEERRVLRGRMVIEAIADQLGGGTFTILVVSQAGSWTTAYFDGDLFREAYESGTITVIEPHPKVGGSLCFDGDGNVVVASTWGLAVVDRDSGITDPATGVMRYDAEQVAENKGDRLVYISDGDKLGIVGASVYDHPWVGDAESLGSLRGSVPTARMTLMGRKS
jgi:hypothetical protein